MDRRQFLQASTGGLVLSSMLPNINTAFADESKSAALIQTLPKDGVWAEFNVNVTINGKEVVPKWSARSVGQALHGGKQCRFIEMEQVCDHPELANVTWRLLIPEDEFGEGKDPFSKAVKRWVKYEGSEPELIETIETKDPSFAMLLAGPKQNIKTEETKEKVSWQMAKW